MSSHIRSAHGGFGLGIGLRDDTTKPHARRAGLCARHMFNMPFRPDWPGPSSVRWRVSLFDISTLCASSAAQRPTDPVCDGALAPVVRARPERLQAKLGRLAGAQCLDALAERGEAHVAALQVRRRQAGEEFLRVLRPAPRGGPGSPKEAVCRGGRTGETAARMALAAVRVSGASLTRGARAGPFRLGHPWDPEGGRAAAV